MSVELMILMGLAAFVLGGIGLARLLGAARNRVRQRAEAIASKRAGHAASAPGPVHAPPTLFSGWVSRLMGPERVQREADLLAAADWELWPGEFVTVRLASGAVCALIGMLVTDWALVAAALAVAGYYVPYAIVATRHRQRRMLFERQLPHMLQLVVSSLRSGSSFARSLEVAAQSCEPPMSKDLEVVLRESSFGVPLDEALHAMARRVQSDDFDVVVSAYQVQREAGGNLAMVMDKVAETVRQRLRLRGELRVLTAQGRLSGWVLALLPIAVSLVLVSTSPRYFDPLLNNSLGQWIFFGAVIWQLIGVLLMRRLVNIRI